MRSEPSKSILITGARGGIGHATVARLVDLGHSVFAADRTDEGRGGAFGSHPLIEPVQLDVTDQVSIERAVQHILAATSGRGVDVVINAAGIMVLGPVEAVPDARVRAQFDVNVFGLLAVTRAFLPQMRERGSGRIVNVSSVLGRFALPGSGVYSASKFAIEAISDAMRIELAPFGVRVVLVEPGVVETGLYRSADESLAGYDGSLDTYRRAWPRGFSFPQWLMRHASSADAVAEVIARAALTPDPRERYRPGLRNRMNVRLLTRLPASVSDGIKTRLVGMERART
jgi:NAD(P)-dependent dehydrogenase (short-subunit alcohol dehydrogenase family)